MRRKPNNINNIDAFIISAKDTQFQLNQPEKNEKTEKTQLKRQTYYITPVLIKALSLMAAFEGLDKSEIVRKSLQEFIPEKYLNQAKELEDEVI